MSAVFRPSVYGPVLSVIACALLSSACVGSGPVLNLSAADEPQPIDQPALAVLAGGENTAEIKPANTGLPQADPGLAVVVDGVGVPVTAPRQIPVSAQSTAERKPVPVLAIADPGPVNSTGETTIHQADTRSLDPVSGENSGTGSDTQEVASLPLETETGGAPIVQPQPLPERKNLLERLFGGSTARPDRAVRRANTFRGGRGDDDSTVSASRQPAAVVEPAPEPAPAAANADQTSTGEDAVAQVSGQQAPGPVKEGSSDSAAQTTEVASLQPEAPIDQTPAPAVQPVPERKSLLERLFGSSSNGNDNSGERGNAYRGGRGEDDRSRISSAHRTAKRETERRSRPKRIVLLERDVANASLNPLPGVKSTRELLGISPERGSRTGRNRTQLASVGGLGVLSPNGLRVQHDKVKVACLKPGVIRLLKMVERRYGSKPIITSGYRSPKRNRRAGGARNSQHIFCKAVDIQVEGVSKWELAKFLRTLPGRGGVGTYCRTRSVHIDIGSKRDWHHPCRRRSLKKRKKA